MENIAPSLLLLWEIKRSLETGRSVSAGIKNYLKRSPDDDFKSEVEIWWLAMNNDQIKYNKSHLNLKRHYLLQILELGLKGHSIANTLESLEDELILSCEDEIQLHVARLPLLALFPLMVMIFPSMMLLVLMPLLRMLQF